MLTLILGFLRLHPTLSAGAKPQLFDLGDNSIRVGGRKEVGTPTRPFRQVGARTLEPVHDLASAVC
ncbi:MAG: hypothetical protein ACRD2W_11675 [Acidimicrobiales bacterium]